MQKLQEDGCLRPFEKWTETGRVNVLGADCGGKKECADENSGPSYGVEGVVGNKILHLVNTLRKTLTIVRSTWSLPERRRGAGLSIAAWN